MNWWNDIVDTVSDFVAPVIHGIEAVNSWFATSASAAFGLAVDLSRDVFDSGYREQNNNGDSGIGNAIGQSFDRFFNDVGSNNSADSQRWAGDAGKSALNTFSNMWGVKQIGEAYHEKDRALTTVALMMSPNYTGQGDWHQAWMDSDKTNLGNVVAAQRESASKEFGPTQGLLGIAQIRSWLEDPPANQKYTVAQLNQGVKNDLSAQIISNAANVANDWFADPAIVGGKVYALFRVAALDRPVMEAGKASRAIPDLATFIKDKTGLDFLSDEQALTPNYNKAVADAHKAYDKAYGKAIERDKALMVNRQEQAKALVDESFVEGTGAHTQVTELSKMNIDELANHSFIKSLTGDRGTAMRMIANEKGNVDNVRTLWRIIIGDQRAIDQADKLRATTIQMLNPKADALSELAKPLFSEGGKKVFAWEDKTTHGLMGEALQDYAKNDPVFQALSKERGAEWADETLGKIDTLSTEVNKLSAQESRLSDIADLGSQATNMTASKFSTVEQLRAARARSAASWQNDPSIGRGSILSTVYRASPLSYPVRFIHWASGRQPTGFLTIKGTDAGNGLSELYDWLNSSSLHNRGSFRTLADDQGVVLTGGQRKQQMMDLYAQAGTETERYAAIAEIEKTMLTDIADHYGVDRLHANEIYDGHNQGRSRAIEILKQTGYINSDGEILHAPDAVTQLESSLPLAQLDRYEALMSRNATQLQLPGQVLRNGDSILGAAGAKVSGQGLITNDALMRGYRGVRRSAGATMDAANNAYRVFEALWKPAVLLFRLGYPIRNLTEANLRSAAYINTIGSASWTKTMGRALGNTATQSIELVGNALMGRGPGAMERKLERDLRNQGLALDQELETNTNAVRELQRQHDEYSVDAKPPDPMYGQGGQLVYHGTTDVGALNLVDHGIDTKRNGGLSFTTDPEEAMRYAQGQAADPNVAGDVPAVATYEITGKERPDIAAATKSDDGLTAEGRISKVDDNLHHVNVEHFDQSGTSLGRPFENPDRVAPENRDAVANAYMTQGAVYRQVLAEKRQMVAEQQAKVDAIQAKRDRVVDSYFYAQRQFTANNKARLSRRTFTAAEQELRARREKLDGLQAERDNLDPNGNHYTYSPERQNGLDPADLGLAVDEATGFPIDDGSPHYRAWLLDANGNDAAVRAAVRSGTLEPKVAKDYLASPESQGIDLDALAPEHKQGTVMYHGTTLDDAHKIVDEGFDWSKTQMESVARNTPYDPMPGQSVAKSVDDPNVQAAAFDRPGGGTPARITYRIRPKNEHVQDFDRMQYGPQGQAPEGVDYVVHPSGEEGLIVDPSVATAEKIERWDGSKWVLDRQITQTVEQKLAILDQKIYEAEKSYRRLAAMRSNAKAYDNQGKIVIAGQVVPDAFNGASGEAARQSASSSGTWSAMTSDPASAIARGGEHTMKYNYGAVEPGAANYYTELARVLNQHWRMDPLYRKIFEGENQDKLFEWMRGTGAGRSYMRRMSVTNDPEAIRAHIQQHVDTATSYTGGNRALQSALLERSVSPKELEVAIPKERLAPIHGRIYDAKGNPELAVPLRGAAKLGAKYQALTDKLFSILGTIPENKLARFPFYANQYERKLDVLVHDRLAYRRSIGEEEALSNAEVMDLHYKAHQYALSELKSTLYTLEKQSNLAGMMRFVMPFFAATENAVRTWAHLAYLDPSIVPIGLKVWNTPEMLAGSDQFNDALTVVDKNGRPVHGRPDGWLNNDDTIRFRAPAGWYKIMRNMGFSDDTANTVTSLLNRSLRKGNADVITQGLSFTGSWGPTVTLPASEIIKHNPGAAGYYEDIHFRVGPHNVKLPGLKAAVPYGPDTGALSVGTLLPNTARQAIKAFNMNTRKDPTSDAEFASMARIVLRDQLQDYDEGRRATPPTMDEVINRTKLLAWVQVASSMTMPAQTNPISRYQPYIDAFRALQKKDYASAQEKFIAKYGEDMWRFTVSTSDNQTGISATDKAYENLKKYPKLVAELDNIDPRMIGMVVNGQKGTSTWMDTVNDWMNGRPVATGSSTDMRGGLSLQDYKDKMTTVAVWRNYNQGIAQLEHMAQTRAAQNDGKVSISPTTNSDLWDLKQKFIASLKDYSPAWRQDFEDRDNTKLSRALSALNAVTSNKAYMSEHGAEPLWQAVVSYQDARLRIGNELRRRIAVGEVDPSFGLNDNGGYGRSAHRGASDLRDMWDEINARLRNYSPEFANVQQFYLKHDMENTLAYPIEGTFENKGKGKPVPVVTGSNADLTGDEYWKNRM